MEAFTSVLDQILRLLQMPLNVYGFSFSFWDIMLFSIVAYAILRFIGSVMYD